MRLRFFHGAVLGTALLASLMGHGGGCCEEAEINGPPTGAVCPTPSTLTYNNFGKQFMESYCTRCHDSAKTGDARMGAPEFHDFDTLFGIKAVSNHIDEVAASGPNATNDAMPEENPKPSLAERQMLGEWIACGMPEN